MTPTLQCHRRFCMKYCDTRAKEASLSPLQKARGSVQWQTPFVQQGQGPQFDNRILILFPKPVRDLLAQAARTYGPQCMAARSFARRRSEVHCLCTPAIE